MGFQVISAARAQPWRILAVRLGLIWPLLCFVPDVLFGRMFLVLMVKNLGLMWVAIEARTLVSAFLVSFKFTRSALEATWKYVMVCTVGICLALLEQ